MKRFFVYIIYSQHLQKFYTGSTSLSISDRLEKHLGRYYGNNKFTAKSNDWELYYKIECFSYEQARKIESHIKRMKSKKYIENLILYPEITNKLLARYS